jgi:hypothetical protein
MRRLPVGFLTRRGAFAASSDALRTALAVSVLGLALPSSHGADPNGTNPAQAQDGESSDRNSSNFRWRRTGSSLALTRDGRTVWQYNYDKRQAKPYFHPLATPTGEVLTLNQPPDHVWHHGLWFSWKFINGVNFWEHHGKTGAPEGRTTWSVVTSDAREDYSASITMELKYHAAENADAVLTERRSLDISPPGEGAAYHIDWTSVFTAVQDATLDRSPPRPEQPGGYAGLSMRFADELKQRQAVSLNAPVEFDDGHRFRGASGALEYNGVVHGAPAGVAILDSPANPRHPTSWYIIRAPHMSYVNAALLQNEALSLAAGQRLTLRYRIVVHAGQWNPAKLHSAYQEFAGLIGSAAND